MSDSSDSNASFDSDGAIKCSSPPKSKAKFINKKIKLESKDAADTSDDSDSFDDMDDTSASASPKRSTVEFNQFGCYDKSDDEDDKYLTHISSTQEITLKIKYCSWTIHNFSSSQLNKEGYICSGLYAGGFKNEFQWMFRVERYKQGKEVYYGVYVRTLTHDDSQAEMEFRAYIVELRGHSYRLATSRNFPKREGCKFLGFLRKSHIRDDSYWYYRMIPEDDLTLGFRVHIQFKKNTNQLVDDFKALWKNKKFTDFTLIAMGQEFPVHKAVLAARSPFFAEFFEKKSKTSTLKIDDMEPEAMEQLLRYIYTGRPLKLLKFLKPISAAATKYKLTELKSICENAIKLQA